MAESAEAKDEVSLRESGDCCCLRVNSSSAANNRASLDIYMTPCHVAGLLGYVLWYLILLRHEDTIPMNLNPISKRPNASQYTSIGFGTAINGSARTHAKSGK